MLSTVRIATWNVINGPRGSIEEAQFATIFEAIGNENVGGTAKPIDVLGLAETGEETIGRVEAIFDSLYPATDYAHVISSSDDGGDATGFVYDTSTIELLESVELLGPLTHTTLRAKFRPVGTNGIDDFYHYSVHLKAGAEPNTRAQEASLIRQDADALGEGAHIIVAGDFNMQGSNEDAYANLSAFGAGRVTDVASTLGNWHQNATVRHLHTQDPKLGGSGMDDRFDLQLASDEFFNGTGLEYVDGSFHVFGNDGSHALDGDITSGTGAALDVLSALATASDHLPIVADYEFSSQPGLVVRQSGNQTQVVEDADGGKFDVYHISLATVPMADVTVTLNVDNQLDIVESEYTFTADNAFTPQTVIVRANDDTLEEGTHTSAITKSTVSADENYDGLTSSVIVSILDDDAPDFSINELDSDTPSIDRQEFIELYDGGIGNVSLDGTTLVFFSGAGDTSYASFDLDGQQTDDQGLFVIGSDAVDAAMMRFPSDNFLQNGADAVALYRTDIPLPRNSPLTSADLLDAIVYDTSDSDDAGLLGALTPGLPQIDENRNDAKDTESIRRLPDGGGLFDVGQPSPGMLNFERDTGITFLQSLGGLSLLEADAEDQGDSYQISLKTFPIADVVVTITPDVQLDLGNGAGESIELRFTPDNAIIPQTVNVFAVDDSTLEADHRGLISHVTMSTDPDYSAIERTLQASIADDEVAPTASVVISEIMYNPATEEVSPGVGEWVEIVNTGSQEVDLSGWLFDDEDATVWSPIPAGTTLDPLQIAVLFDQAFATADEFRASWDIDDTALLVGIDWANLANSPSDTNEVLMLLDSSGSVIDEVNFEDTEPWPRDNNSASIYLLGLGLDNSQGQNWRRSNGMSSRAGGPYSDDDIGSPGSFDRLAGDANLDGAVSFDDFLILSTNFGAVDAVFIEGDFDENEVVNFTDFLILSANFG